MTGIRRFFVINCSYNFRKLQCKTFARKFSSMDEHDQKFFNSLLTSPVGSMHNSLKEIMLASGFLTINKKGMDDRISESKGLSGLSSPEPEDPPERPFDSDWLSESGSKWTKVHLENVGILTPYFCPIDRFPFNQKVKTASEFMNDDTLPSPIKQRLAILMDRKYAISDTALEPFQMKLESNLDSSTPEELRRLYTSLLVLSPRRQESSVNRATCMILEFAGFDDWLYGFVFKTEYKMEAILGDSETTLTTVVETAVVHSKKGLVLMKNEDKPLDWSSDSRTWGYGQRQMELLIGALFNYRKGKYFMKDNPRPAYMTATLLSTKGYRSSFVVGYFPIEYLDAVYYMNPDNLANCQPRFFEWCPMENKTRHAGWSLLDADGRESIFVNLLNIRSAILNSGLNIDKSLLELPIPESQGKYTSKPLELK